MSSHLAATAEQGALTADIGIVVLGLVAEFAERVQDWSAILSIHLAMRSRKLQLVPSLLDATCSLPRSLLVDSAVLVAGAVSREAGASVRLRLSSSGVGMRAFFECPLCDRCNAEEVAATLPAGTRVKIEKEPRRYRGQLGVLITPSIASGPYSVRLDDGRVACVPDTHFLSPVFSKFCHHFRGLGSQSHWLQKVSHAWVLPSERRAGMQSAKPISSHKGLALATRATRGREDNEDEEEESLDMLNIIGEMVDAVDNLPRAEI
mmetsp:Transcript_6285/g.15066  ORF Transcript_6285/g.15066 Transcript_6285/m.15066 type:complete len:263 (-) Transcript_6285:121-909(-)